MHTDLSKLDRRKFIRGTGIALALPLFESLNRPALAATADAPVKRFAAFYMPDGVPMPLPEDPAYQDWSWFPHGQGAEFTFTKCLDPLEPLREHLTVFSGLSHPGGRVVHGHENADQFLTGARTSVPGQSDGPYQNSISLDQLFAEQVGDQTRHHSLVLSTDGGVGTPRGAQTMSFNRGGRPIPAEHKPKRVFDGLFVKNSKDAARRLATSRSALDNLLADARALKAELSTQDQRVLDEYLQSLRETEVKVEKAKRWLNIPLPQVDVDHLQLEISPEDPRVYLQTMFELIYLAFKTDSTRAVTYQIGRENGVGVSDYLARAVGFNLTHQLSHKTKEPNGWKNFGTYNRFLAEEYGRFLTRLRDTPDPAAAGSMLDNTLTLFGSASSAFHLSRNYPLILAGGKKMGFKHGQYLKYGDIAKGKTPQGGARTPGTREPWQIDATAVDQPLDNLYLTMLHRLGVETDTFAEATRTLDEV